MGERSITPAQTDALAKLAEIPPAGSEERHFWLEAAEQCGFDLHCDGSFYTAEPNEVLKLMSEAWKQGQRDALVHAEDDIDWLCKQIIELCEDTETKMDEAFAKGPTNEVERAFYRGRAYEAKGIRRAISDVVRLRKVDRAALATGGARG